jgi:hypothetical protein
MEQNWFQDQLINNQILAIGTLRIGKTTGIQKPP